MRSRLAAGVAGLLTRVLLWLYPPSFRRDVGAAMVDDVRRRAADRAATQSAIRASIWLVRLTASLLANAAAAWVESPPRSARTIHGGRSATLSWLDLKLAIRMLLKYPGLTVIGGLGIAMAVAIGVGFFAIFEARFYPIIPLNDGERLVGLQNINARTYRQEHRALHDFVLWRSEMRSIEDMSAFRNVPRNLIAADGSVESIRVAEITPSGFRLARVPPLLGRTLQEQDVAPGAPAVIVIGFDVWRTRFGSDPGIVGRGLRLGPTVHTVVGVMPEDFTFPVNHRYWTPLTIDLSAFKQGEGPAVFVSGRLAPGFDLAAADAELIAIGKRMAAAFPDTHGDRRPEVVPYHYPFFGGSRYSADGFWPMTVLVSLLLVVVCTNLAILIYARTATRMGEIAVRSALGASRRRIVAQLFAESFVLSAVAALAGLAAVKIGLTWAQSMLARFDEETFWSYYRITNGALVYFVVLTVLASVITGLIPALRATGRRVNWNLHQFHSSSGLRLGRTWTSLIVVQVAVASAGLPIATALAWFSVRDAYHVPAFPMAQIVFAEVTIESEPPAGQDAASYRAALPARFARLQAELSRRLAAEPAVVAHAFSSGLPPFGSSGRVAIEHDTSEPRPASTRDVLRTSVDPDFFRTFDVALLAGRRFRPDDRGQNAPDVVIVDRTFASQVLGGDALGRRIRHLPEVVAPGAAEPPRWYEIVGVVEKIESNPFDERKIDPRVYHPMKNEEGTRGGLAVRVHERDVAPLGRRLPQMAAAIDPALQVKVVPLVEAYGAQRAALTTAAAGIGTTLLSVILLSAAGIYALMSFTVSQRRREIAIRTALGAQPATLLRGIFARALRQIATGVVVGVTLALLIDLEEGGQALAGSRTVLLVTTALVMSAVGLLAAFGPARRGLRIEPSEVLKGE